MPQSLIIVISLIMLGFLIALIGTVRGRARARKYTKLEVVSPMNNMKPYQNATEYARPPKQKVVTYSVVDPRLVYQ